ncbi:DUF3465 domain-containing protein [Psychrobacter sp. CAL346-MNA-CIBAN-0220]|uniref:DUF3465 domain-containing protein n=1 Tax=Psychrobacter sp. CAL346-MNA-CIBAN-0220 TaxID=3140457 RepID=UPI00331A2762
MNVLHKRTLSVWPTLHLALLLLAAVLILTGCQPGESLSPTADNQNSSNTNSSAINYAKDNNNDNACQNTTITAAFKAQQSDRQVKGCGTIIKALADDNEGSRHQKILVKLDGISPTHTVLLVHNIDIAPRVANVVRGTRLRFYGEYVYNNKGGLIHWTHHDPAARHQGGWIDGNDIRYQ